MKGLKQDGYTKLNLVDAMERKWMREKLR